MMWVSLYLIAGVLIAVAVQRGFRDPYQTKREYIASVFWAAILWGPALAFVVLTWPFALISIGCEEVSQTKWWVQFQKWLDTPARPRKA